MSFPLRSISRRLLRPAASFLCLLSLLLCVAACWMWIGSGDADSFVASLARAGRTTEIRSKDGRLVVLRINGSRRAPQPHLVATGDVSFSILSLINAPPQPVKKGFA